MLPLSILNGVEFSQRILVLKNYLVESKSYTRELTAYLEGNLETPKHALQKSVEVLDHTSGLEASLTNIAILVALIEANHNVNSSHPDLIDSVLEQWIYWLFENDSPLSEKSHRKIIDRVFVATTNSSCRERVLSCLETIIERKMKKGEVHEDLPPMVSSLMTALFSNLGDSKTSPTDGTLEFCRRMFCRVLGWIRGSTLGEAGRRRCLTLHIPEMITAILSLSERNPQLMESLSKELLSTLMSLLGDPGDLDLVGLVQSLDFIQEYAGREELQRDDLTERLKKSLVGDDLTCKRSRFILERIWRSRNDWRFSFLLLYDQLDEFGLHLVEQGWERIDQLQPPRSTDSDVIPAAAPWMYVIWTKGLLHKNHQVNRLVLRKFLERKWPTEFLKELSFDFVLGVLVQAAASEGIQFDSSDFDYQVCCAFHLTTIKKFVAKAEIESFFEVFVDHMLDEDRYSFLLKFLEKVFTADISRTALRSCVSIFSVISDKIPPNFLSTEQSNELLFKIHGRISVVCNVHGASFKLRIFKSLMKTIQSLIPAKSVSLGCLSASLTAFPDSFVAPGGELRDDLIKWLFEEEDVLIRSAIQILTNSLDDAQNSLEECIKIAPAVQRMHGFLLERRSDQCQMLYKCLERHLFGLYNRPYKPIGLELKAMCMTRALLQGALEVSVLNVFFTDTVLKASEDIYSFLSVGVISVLKQPFGGSVSEADYQAISLSADCFSISTEYLRKCQDQSFQRFVAKCQSLIDQIFDKATHHFKSGQFSLGQVAVNEILLYVLSRLLPFYTQSKNLSCGLEFIVKIPISQLSQPAGRFNDRRTLRWKSLLFLLKHRAHIPMHIKVDLVEDLVNGLQEFEQSSFVPMIKLMEILTKELVADPVLALETSSSLSSDSQSSAASPLTYVISTLLRSLWSAFLDSDKKMESIEITTRVAISPVLFQTEELHEDGGPVSWMVMNLIDHGLRSPRVLLSTTLRLVTCLSEKPALLKFYLPHLAKIILHDSKETGHPDTEAQSRFKWPEGFLDEELVRSFQSSLAAPRVAIGCFVHYLTTLSDIGDVGDMLWDHLIRIATTDETQTQIQYRIGSSTHRSKLRLWQILAMVSPLIEDPDKSIPVLMDVLTAGNIASVRMYVEMSVVSVLKTSPERLREFIFPILLDYGRRHQSLPACMLVTLQARHLLSPLPDAFSKVVMSCTDRILHKELLLEAARAIFPWCMTHNHSTRAFAQLTTDAIYNYIGQTEDLKYLISGDEFCLEQDLNIWPNVRRYLMDNKEFARLKRGLGSSLSQLTTNDLTLTPSSIFAKPTDDEEVIGFESVPQPLIEAIQIFLADERIKVRESNDLMMAMKERGSVCLADPSEKFVHASSNVQQKIVPGELQTLIWGDIDPSYSDVFREGDFSCKDRKLIVVASLIDKIPNLAGLARSCEVFGVESLVLADKSVAKNSQFRAISVSAEDWIHVEEVKEVAILPWLLGRRSQGYSLIGLEQTSGSVSLRNFCFPEKSVLLLGKEKEGIPADLLQILDYTVEIPQFGVIRSLNVHVSGALAMYAFAADTTQTATKKTDCV